MFVIKSFTYSLLVFMHYWNVIFYIEAANNFPYKMVKTILRIHVTSPILGERISAIILPQQPKQWLSVELNRRRSERICCYF